jgi:hypothetical protein
MTLPLWKKWRYSPKFSCNFKVGTHWEDALQSFWPGILGTWVRFICYDRRGELLLYIFSGGFLRHFYRSFTALLGMESAVDDSSGPFYAKTTAYHFPLTIFRSNTCTFLHRFCFHSLILSWSKITAHLIHCRYSHRTTQPASTTLSLPRNTVRDFYQLNLAEATRAYTNPKQDQSYRGQAWAIARKQSEAWLATHSLSILSVAI